MRRESLYRVVRSIHHSSPRFHAWTSESPPLASNVHGSSDCVANHCNDDWAGIRSAYAAELLARVAACHVDGPSSAVRMVVLRLCRLLRCALERSLTKPNLPLSTAQKQTGAGSATLPAGGPFLLSYIQPDAPHCRIGRSRPADAPEQPLAHKDKL